jgi:hypothetical protein
MAGGSDEPLGGRLLDWLDPRHQRARITARRGLTSGFSHAVYRRKLSPRWYQPGVFFVPANREQTHHDGQVDCTSCGHVGLAAAETLPRLLTGARRAARRGASRSPSAGGSGTTSPSWRRSGSAPARRDETEQPNGRTRWLTICRFRDRYTYRKKDGPRRGRQSGE